MHPLLGTLIMAGKTLALDILFKSIKTFLQRGFSTYFRTYVKVVEY